MIKWTTVTRKIKDLKPHPKNPRKLSKDDAAQLKISLQKFGLADKPIINQDNMIIGGHQRIKVLKSDGHKEVECLVPDRLLTQEEVDEYNIRLNRNVGEWDWDILANEWEALDLLEFGFRDTDLVGFDDDEEETKSKKENEKKVHICPKCGEEF